MMGRQIGDQASFFYEFRLDDRVPKDHLLRRINRFLTPVLGGLHAQLRLYYSEIGRPSIDPELMIRMLIVGYCYGLRSERKLSQEVELHHAARLERLTSADAKAARLKLSLIEPALLDAPEIIESFQRRCCESQRDNGTRVG